VVIFADYVVGISALKTEGDAILVVDADAIAARLVTFERFESVAGWHAKVG
jgi:hypothetical protein